MNQNQSQSLFLRYGMEVCLRSRRTLKYMGFNEQQQTTNATSMPPYIEIAGIKTSRIRKLPSLKLRMVCKDPKDQGEIVTFGAKVLFVDCETQCYVVCTPSKSTIGFDKPGLNEDGNQMLQKVATFTLLDDRNVRSRQPISVYDQVHLKSVMGKFIVCDAAGEVTVQGESARQQTAWNIMRADTPLIESWVYQRPAFAKFMSIPSGEYFQNLTPGTKNSLGSLPSAVQEMKIVEDLLDVMLSFDGQFISKNPRGGYTLQPGRQKPTCNPALAELTKKILLLPNYYWSIQNYISTYSIQQGIICQALCSGLRQVVKQYKMMINQFDQQVQKRGLTLQEMWYHIQPSLQLLQSIVQLLKQAQNKKGGQLLTAILKMLNGSTSEQVVKIYTFLFDQCIRKYIQMISKWLYEGVIQDKYQQFMIMEVEKDKDKPWLCWEQKYVLRREQVPSLFQRDAHLILVTGKYLNVMKSCPDAQLEEHPLFKEIQKNIDKHVKIQDFTQSIMRAYDWANQKLKNLILKNMNFEQVLKSVKGYYFLGFGDLFVHFMDSAEADLGAKSAKFSIDNKSKPISVQKLQNLFELLIRTSSANSDPYKEDIICKLENNTIYQQICKIKTLQYENSPNQRPFIKKESKNVDYFNLDFKSKFPLNLILNRRNISKYQVLFRYIFWCKFTERQLSGVWMQLQKTKIINVRCFKKANLLLQKMLNFIKGLIYYLSYEVIEKNWRNLQVSLSKIKNFEDIISAHNQFLAKCLNESLLLNSNLLKIITNDLGSTFQSFTSIKRYASIFDPNQIQSKIDPKSSILVQRRQRKKDIEAYFDEWMQENDLQNVVEPLNKIFDDNMKKILRDIYQAVNKDQASSHLASLLDTLDPKKFYNKHLFEGFTS